MRHGVLCSRGACLSQVASFWWAKGGPIDSRSGAVANGETAAAATASDPTASYFNVVRGMS